MLKIDDHFHIKFDANNAILVQLETKTRQVKDSPGKEESYTAENEFYYPTVEACLRTYMQKSLEPCKDLPEVLAKLDEIHKTIKSFKK